MIFPLWWWVVDRNTPLFHCPGRSSYWIQRIIYTLTLNNGFNLYVKRRCFLFRSVSLAVRFWPNDLETILDQCQTDRNAHTRVSGELLNTAISLALLMKVLVNPLTRDLDTIPCFSSTLLMILSSHKLSVNKLILQRGSNTVTKLMSSGHRV